MMAAPAADGFRREGCSGENEAHGEGREREEQQDKQQQEREGCQPPPPHHHHHQRRVSLLNASAYEFVSDRMRAVRQDLSMQRVAGREAADLLVPMVRGGAQRRGRGSAGEGRGGEGRVTGRIN